MSMYTTELRYICESYAGLTESAGYNNIENVIKIRTNEEGYEALQDEDDKK